MHPPQNKILNPKISIHLESHIGKGSTGDVYKGTSLHPHPHPIAVKAIPLQQITNEVTAYLLQCELEALKAVSAVDNHSIVKLEDIIVIDGYCYIAMELLEGGTLKSYIAERKKLEESKAFFILGRILDGYRILKHHGIIHRDLKPDNIIFQQPPTDILTPKIIDFGYCQLEKASNRPKGYYNVGSPRYMSPEAYSANQYSQKSDIWSIGVIFYQMLTGTNFDKGMNIIEAFQVIKEKGIPIPYSLSNKAKRLLQGMLMISPQNRMTCEQAIQELFHSQKQNTEYMNPEDIRVDPKIRLVSQERILQRERGHKRKIDLVSMPKQSLRTQISGSLNMNSLGNLRRIISKPVVSGQTSPPKKQTDMMYHSSIHKSQQRLNLCTSLKNLYIPTKQKQNTIRAFSDKNSSPNKKTEIEFSKRQPKDRQNSFSFKVYRCVPNSNANFHYLQAPRTRMPIVHPFPNQKNEIPHSNNKSAHYRQPNTNFTFSSPKKTQPQRINFFNHSSQRHHQNGFSNAQTLMRKTIDDQKIINPGPFTLIPQVNATRN